jgi:hypothetical protein
MDAGDKHTRMYLQRPLKTSPIPKSSVTENLYYINGFQDGYTILLI